jgi:8-oxo-dGTP pyrophosphatase MutT (NUDIX family)
MITKEKIRQTLSRRERMVIQNPQLTPAAVLLPLYQKEGNCHLLFTKRTEGVAYHKGQICFPGGSSQKEDGGVEVTALRESFEELGIDAEDVEILGALDDEVTLTTNFVISPIVGSIPYPYQFKINPTEIDEIIEIPIAVLLNKDNFREEINSDKDIPSPSYFYEYQGHLIWGATARILKDFLDLIFPNAIS